MKSHNGVQIQLLARYSLVCFSKFAVSFCLFIIIVCQLVRGGDLGGQGDRPLQIIRWRGRRCFYPLQYLENVIVNCHKENRKVRKRRCDTSDRKTTRTSNIDLLSGGCSMELSDIPTCLLGKWTTHAHSADTILQYDNLYFTIAGSIKNS